MRLMHWLPWAIAAVAVALLAWTWTADRRIAADPQAGDATAGGAAGVTPGGSDPTAQPMPGVGGPSVGTGTGRAPIDREEMLARIEARRPRVDQAARERQRQQLEATFAADPPDPVGGPQAELALSDVAVGDAMGSTGIAPKDLQVDCRQSLCKVQGTFDRNGNAQDWSILYLTAAGGQLGSARIIETRQPDGTVAVTIYGSRGPSR
jgi:hypothetical protein